jgi:PemK-like, MazF-like toxin of type II toxin-antitoxin system
LIGCLKGKIKNMTNSTETTSDFNPAFEQGHIWIAPMWQDREKSFKPRPVLIIGQDANDDYDIVVNVITSEEKWEDQDDFTIPIKFWEYAGLDSKSWVRVSKIATIARNRIKQDVVFRKGRNRPRGYIGKMHERDFVEVQQLLKNLF